MSRVPAQLGGPVAVAGTASDPEAERELPSPPTPSYQAPGGHRSRWALLFTC